MKRTTIASVLLIALPLALMAQTPKKVPHKAKRITPSQLEIKSTAVQMAAGIRAAEAALSPAELAIAALIYQGSMSCELGASVSVTADAKSPGYFDLQIKNIKYRMLPVVTSTGAIRLEDQQAGAVWLQLSNKSMLMNQKIGQRLADVCMNPDQAIVAERLVKSPAPGLLDAPIVVAQKPNLPASAPTAVASLPEAPVAVALAAKPPASAPAAVPNLPEAPVAVALAAKPPASAPAAVPSLPEAPVAVVLETKLPAAPASAPNLPVSPLEKTVK